MPAESLLFDPGSEYHVIRGSGFVLHANWNSLRNLNSIVSEGIRFLPRRGLEVGGLLLGSSTGSEIRLAAIQAVPIQHQFGPSYQLSEADVDVFRAAIH